MRADHARRGRPRPAASRRATVYVLVLGVAAIATAAGVGGLYVQRTRLRQARSATEIDRARLLAASGLEYALARIDGDANWRTTLGAGTWHNATLGPGTLTVAVADPVDADIANNQTDAVRIASQGVVGSARQGLAATIAVSQTPHTVLSCAAYGGTHVHFGAMTLNADGPVASGANMTALLASVRAPVEAVGTATGLTYVGPKTENAVPRTAPGTSIADEWAVGATSITYASIPSKQLRRVVIAGGVTVHSAAISGSGIAVVDCGGGALEITETRIYGTLVVLNTSGVTVTGSVRIDPATAGYPSLIVEGPLTISISSAALSESSNNTNYNPSGVPWQGATNTTRTNTYPSGFSGIVLATGDIVNSNSNLVLTGSLISLGALTFNGGGTITVDAGLLAAPAPGFFSLVPEVTRVERVTY